MPEQNFMGGTEKLVPLISFDTIIDSDFGLANLVYEKYLDKNVFDVDKFKKNTLDIISNIYNREDKNLLYLFSKDEFNKNILDQYYKEFIDTKIKDIYEMSITTEVLNMIDVFNTSQEIIPTILCYSNEQINALLDEPILKNNKKILLSDLSDKDKEEYTQFFFKDLDEVIPFIDLKFRSFYFSTYRLNFDEEGKDLRDKDIVNVLIKNHVAVNIFDVYQRDIIERN